MKPPDMTTSPATGGEGPDYTRARRNRPARSALQRTHARLLPRPIQDETTPLHPDQMHDV